MPIRDQPRITRLVCRAAIEATQRCRDCERARQPPSTCEASQRHIRLLCRLLGPPTSHSHEINQTRLIQPLLPAGPHWPDGEDGRRAKRRRSPAQGEADDATPPWQAGAGIARQVEGLRPPNPVRLPTPAESCRRPYAGTQLANRDSRATLEPNQTVRVLLVEIIASIRHEVQKAPSDSAGTAANRAAVPADEQHERSAMQSNELLEEHGSNRDCDSTGSSSRLRQTSTGCSPPRQRNCTAVTKRLTSYARGFFSRVTRLRGSNVPSGI